MYHQPHFDMLTYKWHCFFVNVSMFMYVHSFSSGSGWSDKDRETAKRTFKKRQLEFKGPPKAPVAKSRIVQGRLSGILKKARTKVNVITKGPPTKVNAITKGPPTKENLIAQVPAKKVNVIAQGPPTKVKVIAQGPPTKVKVIAQGPPTKVKVIAQGPQRK